MVSVEVLRCARCGAPVPLGLIDVPVVPCLSCGASVAVPPAHRELRAAVLADREAHDRGERILAQLAKPPSDFARTLAENKVAWVATITPTMLILTLVALAPTLYLQDVMHLRLEDVVRPWQRTLLYAVPFVVAVVPALILLRIKRAASSRLELQRALAAIPPAHAGGPSTCRACGAPLSVADDGVGQRCVYCGADNLLDLDFGSSEKRFDVSAAALATADDALARERIVRAGERRIFALSFAGSVLFCATGGALSTSLEKDGFQTGLLQWQDARAAALWPTRDEAALAAHPPVGLGSSIATATCSARHCTATYLVALGYEEKLRVTVHATGEKVHWSLNRIDHPTEYDCSVSEHDAFTMCESTKTNAQPIVLETSTAGWYRFAIVYEASPRVSIDVASSDRR